MKFVDILPDFFEDLCKRAAEQEHPEDFLTRDYIAESFLSFVDQ